MDNMYNQGRNQHTIPGVLRDPSGRVVQPQPVSYETISISDGYAQNSSVIPGGVQMFIKARSSAPPEQRLFQPGSPPVPPRTISQKVRADPSYQLLAIAIVAVLIASSVLAAFLATGNLGAIAHNHATPNQPQAKAQAAATARSTQGHTTTIPTPTPTLVPTPANLPVTPQPTQTSQNPGGTPPPGSAPQTTSGTISIQFVNLPQQISVNSSAGVYNLTVKTQPNLKVFLEDDYASAPEGPFYAGQGYADESGIATFGWNVINRLNLTRTPQTTSVVLIAYVHDGNGNMGQVQTTVSVVITQ